MESFKYIGEARLSSYNDYDEYFENIRQSQSFYSSLAILEVSLRNKVDLYMTDKVGINWIYNKKYHRKTNPKHLNYSKNKLIPELNFGFWVHLFSFKRGAVPFNEDEYKAFFNGYNGTVKDIYLMLQQVLIFRNRVFHYEKIINDERFVNIDIVIKEVLKMIDVNLLSLVEDIGSLK